MKHISSAINNSDLYIDAFLTKLTKKTRLLFMLVSGGPEPKQGGKIMQAAYVFYHAFSMLC